MGGLIGFIVDKLRERSDKQGTYGESYEGRLGGNIYEDGGNLSQLEMTEEVDQVTLINCIKYDVASVLILFSPVFSALLSGIAVYKSGKILKEYPTYNFARIVNRVSIGALILAGVVNVVILLMLIFVEVLHEVAFQ